ncbi:PAS domain S-box protein [Desulfolithobacter sp.]
MTTPSVPSAHSPKRRRAPWHFFLFVLLSAALLASVLLYHAYWEKRHDVGLLQKEETLRLQTGKAVIEREIGHLISDVGSLAGIPCLRKWTHDPNDPLALKSIAIKFQSFARHKIWYDQIRLINLDGKEIVRVNATENRPVIVPPEELQDKSNRYYFSDLRKLKKGEIYISPLDLNVEHGKIDTPCKPTLRLAAPIIDEQGSNRGVVLINYQGTYLLQLFKEAFFSNTVTDGGFIHYGQPMILNREGYWLLSSNPDDEWGFMLDHGHNFGSRFPEAWNALNNQQQGQIFTNQGLFSFSRLYPLRPYTGNEDKAELSKPTENSSFSPETYFWYLVVHVPSEQLAGINLLFTRLHWDLFSLILLASLPLLWQLSVLIEQHREAKKRLETQEKRYRHLYNNMPLAYQSLDQRGIFLDVNPAWLDIMGYEEHEVLGHNFADFLPAAEQDRFIKHFSRFKHEGTAKNIVLQLIKKDGSLIHVSFNGSISYDCQRNFLRTHCVFRDITRELQLEERSKKQTKLLEIIVNTTPDIICLKDGEGRWLLANQPDLELFELTEVAYQGKTDADLASFSPSFRDAFLTCMESDEAAWLQGVPVRSIEHIPTSGGSVKTYDVLKTPLFNHDGTRQALVVVGRDITELLRNENRLKHLNLVLETMVHIHQEIDIHQDPATLLNSCCSIFVKNRGYNSAWIVLFDENGAVSHTAHTGLGKNFEQLEAELRQQRFPACIKAAMDSGDVISITDINNTCRHCPLRNGYLEAGIMTAPLQHNNKIYGFLTVSVPKEILGDKEEKGLFGEIAADLGHALFSLELEEKRQQSEAKLQAAMESLEDAQKIARMGYYERNWQTGEGYWSDNLYRIFGYAPDEIPCTQDKALSLVHPEDREYVIHNINQAHTTCQPAYNLQFRIIRKDNTVRTVRLIGRCAFTENGQPLQHRGICQDITDQKRLEEQLLQSEKMTTIAGLAAGVAHEINTPLSAVLQSVQIIRHFLDSTLSENRKLAAEHGIDLNRLQAYFKSREIDFFLEGIHTSASNAARIISNLLEFSRPHKGELAPASLNGLMDNAVELARADYDLKKKYDILNVQIIRKYDAKLPPVRCVAMEIEQVILNLIKNAVQAMAEGGQKSPRIVLRTEKANSMARFVVEDNGPGMSEEVRKHIFEPFFTTKEVGCGTGLGLSVSYAIICEKHQGSISVVSEPNQGACFSVELPLACSDILPGAQ